MLLLSIVLIYYFVKFAINVINYVYLASLGPPGGPGPRDRNGEIFRYVGVSNVFCFWSKIRLCPKKNRNFFCARSTQNVLKRVLKQNIFFRFFGPIFGPIFGTFWHSRGCFSEKI